ncbi:MAG: hypothetical protein ACYDER_03300 [Ktedonobacteraceae bacterium]
MDTPPLEYLILIGSHNDTIHDIARFERKRRKDDRSTCYFYLGETRETMRMTLEFLEKHLPYVTSVSAYLLLLYPGSSLETTIAKVIAETGGSLVQDAEWQGRHLWPVNVSPDLKYDTLQDIGLQFTKAFLIQKTFYRKKHYSSFAPQITENMFLAKVEEIGREYLPFSLDENEATTVRRRLWQNLAD